MDQLPEGWESRLDQSTGRYYFVDHNTKTTQWNHPNNQRLYVPSNSTTNAAATGSNGENEQPQQQQQQHQERPVDSRKTRDTKLVSSVVRRARLFEPEVDAFNGTQKDREYTRLMETLEQFILELDAVEIQGQEDMRAMRRAAIVEIQGLIQLLENRSKPAAENNNNALVLANPPD